jgi:hypothetical protein
MYDPSRRRLKILAISHTWAVLVATAWTPAAAVRGAEPLPLPHQLRAVQELPDVLTSLSGQPIVTPADWRERRRSELQRLFQHYMYGRLPAAPPRTAARLLFLDREFLGGTATLREFELNVGPAGTPRLRLLVATPNSSAKSPCFLGLNFAGNHTLVDDQRVRLPEAWLPPGYPGVVKSRATEAGRNGRAHRWPIEKIIQRGYGLASVFCGDIQPDRPTIREGMRATMPVSSGRSDPTDTGTIMWWAWGLHRAVDHLESDDAVDPQRIAVVGHSRLGKAALVAGAFDERIALIVANQAGCGGSAPSRTDQPRAERIDLLNGARPHWFCENFKAFGAEPARLPFDQHSLVAICAPRPVLFTCAAEDLGANPIGQLEVLRAATPAYRLLGVDGLKGVPMPEPDAPLIDSRLGYWLRSGKHDMTHADWDIYLQFADRWLQPKP